MKNFPKILIIISLLAITFVLASSVFAQKDSNPIKFNPQVDIPGGENISFAERTTEPIAIYVKNIYKYALGIVGILATVMMMFAGMMWIMAGGNAEKVANAKSYLTAALTGLVLALSSYLILYTVNPSLVNFRITGITKPGKTQNCCSEKKGPFNGFITTTSFEQSYTCIPQTDQQKEEYGNTEQYDPPIQQCVYKNDKYTVTKSCTWRAVGQTDCSYLIDYPLIGDDNDCQGQKPQPKSDWMCCCKK